MTREETKDAIEVMKAYIDGKPIQYRAKDCKWVGLGDEEPDWDFFDGEYRIKPESKLRPYTFEELCEAVKKHGGYVISKDRTVLNHINVADVRGVFENHHTDSVYKYDELLEKFVWLDDKSRCGVTED